MKAIRFLWGLLFRLFPCPVPTGLRAVGEPGPDSPVLVTCNFDLTVRRLLRVLRRAGVDAWLLVADSKGVNVWCAAGAHEFDDRAVVAALKTSGVGERVRHRRLILPPLGAPGIRASEVERRTGWRTLWGPVHAGDLPAFLAAGGETRSPEMCRADYRWRERLDTALGSLFPFFLLGVLGFALVAPARLPLFLLLAVFTFLFFFLSCPWLPGRRGLSKALLLDAPLGAALLAHLLGWLPGGPTLSFALGTTMLLFLVWGTELGGLASTMASELDPFLARRGIGAIGNVALAGTLRTELLNGYRVLGHRPELCTACGSCVAVCPLGVWEEAAGGKSRLARLERCTACTACLRQCPSGAIQARKTVGSASAAPIQP